MSGVAIVDERFCFPDETNLTVRKTSVFFPGDGFIVYDPNGEIILRFDSYGPDSEPKHELILMDASGKCLLTLLRKTPSLHQRWEGFFGERLEGQHPIFSVYKSSIIGQSNLMVEVHGDPSEEYQVKGSFSRRCCKIYNTSLGAPSDDHVAEIKRKVDPSTNVMLGKDVFWLCVKPGFDGAFGMGLVLILDQVYGDDTYDDEQQIDATL
ncbi:protein LURP-one-related 12-like [Tripterygium wilfordii]|uniref:Protein LURP-one-related 12-like n=1 Tax=Tripterygium wilfordii TaxID=458696 RepID=A0A7J7DTZ3_TRIWF|nr:protein LURP-one-related 12-like [Tripterygium wilfordii]KAF5749624.1 protein LURP-one-related 12-like [Tripterygium wilfordii]